MHHRAHQHCHQFHSERKVKHVCLRQEKLAYDDENDCRNRCTQPKRARSLKQSAEIAKRFDFGKGTDDSCQNHKHSPHQNEHQRTAHQVQKVVDCHCVRIGKIHRFQQFIGFFRRICAANSHCFFSVIPRNCHQLIGVVVPRNKCEITKENHKIVVHIGSVGISCKVRGNVIITHSRRTQKPVTDFCVFYRKIKLVSLIVVFRSNNAVGLQFAK